MVGTSRTIRHRHECHWPFTILYTTTRNKLTLHLTGLHGRTHTDSLHFRMHALWSVLIQVNFVCFNYNISTYTLKRQNIIAFWSDRLLHVEEFIITTPFLVEKIAPGLLWASRYLRENLKVLFSKNCELRFWLNFHRRQKTFFLPSVKFFRISQFTFSRKLQF